MANSYSSGTVSVVTGSKIVTITGGLSVELNMRPGDVISIGNATLNAIDELLSPTTFSLVTPHDGTGGPGLDYFVLYMPMGWGDRVELGVQVAELVRLIGQGIITSVNYQTRALLFADLKHAEGQLARVWGDSNPQYIGVYKKAGGTNTGSWTRIGDLPDNAAVTAISEQVATVAASITKVNTTADNIGAVNVAADNMTAIVAAPAQAAAAQTARVGSEGARNVALTARDEALVHAQAAFEVSTGVVLADAPMAIAGINDSQAMTPKGTADVFDVRTGPTVTPEMFGSLGNEDGLRANDDLLAFQKMANYLYAIGGGTVLLTKSSYYLSEYNASDVGGYILGLPAAGISKFVAWPPNVLRRSVGRTGVIMNGGPSSALGFSTRANWLTLPPTKENFIVVTSANQLAHSVVLASVAGLVVGQRVILGRVKGEAGGVPNTPSREISPVQFVTIKSINAGTGVVVFEEAFSQRFDAAQDLRVYHYDSRFGLPGAPSHDSYDENIHFDGVSDANYGYLLVYGSERVGGDRISFGRYAAIQHGSCQDLRIGDYVNDMSPTLPPVVNSIESVNGFRVRSWEINGNGRSYSLGGLLVDDNCRDGAIGTLTVRDFPNGAISLLYGVDAVIDQVKLTNCATEANPIGSFAAGLSMGTPAENAYATMAIAEAAAYKKRNCSDSRIHIKRLDSVGPSKVPVRAHDTDLTIDSARIEYVDSLGGAPILIGSSGDRRADPTYFPAGGQSQFTRGDIDVVTLSGTPRTIRDTNGSTGLFRAADTTLAAAVAPADTIITVANANAIARFATLYFINEAGAGVTAISRTVAGKSGNQITLSSALGFSVANGAGLWTSFASRNMSRIRRAGRFTLDGVEVPVFDGEIVSFPDIPFTYTYTIAPPAAGDWQMDVSLTNDARNAYGRCSYAVLLSGALNNVAEIAGTKYSSSAVAALGAATMAGGVVSIVMTSSGNPMRGEVMAKWTPLRRPSPNNFG